MLQVGLVFTDDLVGDGFTGVLVFQADGGAKHHAAFRVDGGRVDDLRSRELAFNFLDTPFDKPLAVFGGVVFGVFAQIALRTCFGNGCDDPWAVYGLEAMQLGLELFSAAFRDGKSGHGLTSPLVVCR